MGCSDQWTPDEIHALEQQTNKKKFGVELTNGQIHLEVACAACRMLESDELLIRLDPWIRKWWEDHKRADAARVLRATREKRKRELQRSAMEKLSYEERVALGLSPPPGAEDEEDADI